MYQLLYVSSAASDLTQDDIGHILAKSRANNHKNNVSGVLLYVDGSFVQLLEGEKEIVESTYERIKLDTRHKGPLILLSRETESRAFSEWAMAFSNMDFVPTGVMPIPEDGFGGTTSDAEVSKLLNTFLKVTDRKSYAA